MCNIVLVFCLYHMYLIYADYVFCSNKVYYFCSQHFYDVFGFFEFNELCSVYSVGKLSHGHFKACVWYALYVCIA